MECSCTVGTSADECAFGLEINESYPVAGYGVHCFECNRTIEYGEQYLYEEGLPVGEEEEVSEDEWDWHEYDTCLDCQSIRDQFFNGHVYGMILHDLYMFLDESDGSTHEECIANLTPRARGIVCEYIEHIWAEIEKEEQRNNKD